MHDLRLALASLDAAHSSEEMLAAAVQLTCHDLGFTRAALLRVNGDRLVVESTYSSDPDGAPAYDLAAGRRLAELPVEGEIARRRDLIPHTPAAALTRWRAQLATAGTPYVVAPVIMDAQVAGFLRADRHGQPEPVGDLDQIMLWTLVAGFSFAYERTVLRQRMGAGLDAVRQIGNSVDALFEEVSPTAHDWSNRPLPAMGDSRRASGLTAREAEVLALIAGGETNAGIARRLNITEATVKSHVKHILRKLGASHRAEAVSRFLAA